MVMHAPLVVIDGEALAGWPAYNDIKLASLQARHTEDIARGVIGDRSAQKLGLGVGRGKRGPSSVVEVVACENVVACLPPQNRSMAVSADIPISPLDAVATDSIHHCATESQCSSTPSQSPVNNWVQAFFWD